MKPLAIPDDLAETVTGRRPVQIGKDTLMPLGMVIGLLLGILGCYNWLDSRFDGLAQNNNSRFAELTTGLRSVEDRLRDLELRQHRRWDRLDMKDWMLELKRMNPSLAVPPVTSSESSAD